jgi:FixJ family two-component response regulator
MKPRHIVTADDENLAARCAKGRVVIIDDEADIADALQTLLHLTGYACDIFSDAIGYLQALGQEQPVFPGPVCVLCDVRMPQVDGLELQKRLAAIDDTPMLIMSGSSGALEATHAFRQGAQDFLIKPIDSATLLAAIDKALSVSRERKRAQAQQLHIHSRVGQLTYREREVLLRVAQGQTNAAIADALAIALRTVKLHRQRGLEKLKVSGVGDLVRIADALGW